MAEMSVQLVAVERRLWSGTGTFVVAQTTEGEIGILPGHEPVLGQLDRGWRGPGDARPTATP